MKKLITALLIIFAGQQIYAQHHNLSTSRQSSVHIRIYRLSNAEAFQIADKGKQVITDQYLHTLVDSFANDTLNSYKGKLPYGTYLFVKADQNRLSYHQVAIQNVSLDLINDYKNLQFVLRNAAGKEVADARAIIGKNSKVKYDAQAKAYIFPSPAKHKVITVVYDGIYNYYSFDQLLNRFTYNDYNPVSEKDVKNKKPDYKGYMVFNKPKYKPLDTVRLKAYLVNDKGAALYNKSLRVELQESYNAWKEDDTEDSKILGTIKPYREGGYTFDFVLNDSLDLDLDQQYTVLLREFKNNKWTLVSKGTFRYEDYELQTVKFSVRADQQEVYPGKPAILYLSAKDENGLAIADGRVLVKATTLLVQKAIGSKVFVPDLLWETEVKLDPVGETKLVVPEHIFPKADVSFNLECTFLNSNNESHTQRQYLNYKHHSEDVNALLKQDSILFKYVENGQAKPMSAQMLVYYSDDAAAKPIEFAFPAALKLDPRVIRYSFITSGGYKKDIFLNSLRPALSAFPVQSKDSLSVKVTNPNGLSFWYTIFSGDHVLAKGYTSKLDTAIKHTGKKAAHIRFNYLWAGNEITDELTAVYHKDLLTLNYTGPDQVYPGQEIEMELKITDVNKQPVAQTDVSAFAFTSKFGNSPSLTLPDFTEIKTDRKKGPGLRLKGLPVDSSMVLNWQRWGKTLGLDTLAYYQFTHPAEMYVSREILAGETMAQLSPFIVKGGNIVPVHIVYIDDVPVFFDQTDQLQRYSFIVKPGKHQLKLRTTDQLITIKAITLEKGVKTVISFAAEPDNSHASVLNVPAKLSATEAELLNEYLLNIQDNFAGKKAVLTTSKVEYLIDASPKAWDNTPKLIGPLQPGQLRFRSGAIDQAFQKENGYLYTFSKGLLKLKSLPNNGIAFQTDLSIADNIKQVPDYKELALQEGEADRIWDEYLNLRSRTTALFLQSGADYASAQGSYFMQLDSAIVKDMPYVKNILVYRADLLQTGNIYPGINSWFAAVPAGKYQILYLFKDNRYFIEKVDIKGKGQTHFLWSGVKIKPADSLSLKIDRLIKSAGSVNYQNEDIVTEIGGLLNPGLNAKSIVTEKLSAVIVDDQNLPLPGAMVSVRALNLKAIADEKGRFVINAPRNALLRVSFIGFQVSEFSTASKIPDTIRLLADHNGLNEVVVRYASSTVTVVARGTLQNLPQQLQGRVAGITVRGNSIINTDKALAGSDENILDQDIPAFNPSAMRTNFSDYAFWQPKLLTDDKGIARWKVKFPDDITNWSTMFVAMNGHQQSGQAYTAIKSFKTLSANFVAPLFALEADTMNVIGKLMNYSSIDQNVVRKFTFNGQELKNNTLNLKNAIIDTIRVVATGKDSLNFKYMLEQQSGYYDGEIRKIPVLTTGVKETKGYFDVLSKDTTITYTFKPGAGEITFRAESSIFPVLLQEMESMRNYEYLCNEQLASKLKSLLLEKKLRKYLNSTFRYEKDIKDIIKKLQASKTAQGTWGWWENSPEQFWISLHAVEALLEAQKQGYAIQLNIAALESYLKIRFDNQDQQEKIFMLKLMHLLNPKYTMNDWLAGRPEGGKLTLKEELDLMALKQQAGIAIDIDKLLKLQKHTLFGSIYWGEPGYRFWDNSIQNTISVYKILKAEGKHATELDLIRRYFLEQRKDGQWRNTYESALILETIIPDLINDKYDLKPASLLVNGTQTVKDFPFTQSYTGLTNFSLAKKGAAPIYVTAYQQYVNPKPERAGNDLKINTSFVQNGYTLKKLKAGVKAVLKVEVSLRADADYVMIEVPIPAGCSYDNKSQKTWGVETHREYFKDKTSIFCTKLKAGKYSFEIELMPRYSGNYGLNPAKAELMYFPVFYGREGMKRVEIN